LFVFSNSRRLGTKSYDWSPNRNTLTGADISIGTVSVTCEERLDDRRRLEALAVNDGTVMRAVIGY